MELFLVFLCFVFFSKFSLKNMCHICNENVISTQTTWFTLNLHDFFNVVICLRNNALTSSCGIDGN